MPDAKDRDFGPYQVICPIGAGGMGEVFKARDTRLDRIVALKVSRAQFTDRFQREARAVAALNHPHIATLYDVGPEYLVMEYVEGEALRGPLPLPRALTYASQILEALEAAHAKGIVHRDLKPANILIAKSGVKLLDFGLAQIKSVVAVEDKTATMTVTSEGAIAGTLQYMSPEQLQGKEVDARSDIFAFGVVLYEMITGHKAFQGDNAASVISAIMTAEPVPVQDMKPDVPPGVQNVMRLCLKKDPDDRWQSATDIRHVLQLTATMVPAALPPDQPRRRSALAWWVGAAFLSGLLVTAAAFRLAAPKPAEPATFRPLTYSGRAYSPSLSPDGKQVAFLWSGEKGDDFDLYVQLVSGGNPLRMKAHPAGQTAWSADGSRVAFLRTDGLYVMPSLGGVSRRIADFSNITYDSDVAWAPNGAFFVIVTNKPELSRIAGEGGKLQDLTHPAGADDHSPAISPSSDTVAFVRHTSTYNSQLLLLPVHSDGSAAGEPRQITAGVWDINRLSWSADGKEIIFEGSPGSNNPTLWRISREGGKAARITVPNMVAGQPSIGLHGDRLAYVSSFEETKILKLNLGHGDHDTPQPVVEAIGYHSDLAVSPDGSRITFASNRTGARELWLANADGSNQSQLTFFNGPAVGSPRWSPDGKWIAFDGYASGSSDIYIVAADGGNPTQLTTDKSNEVRPSWSHDGKWVYFSSDRGKEREIWKIPAAGGAQSRVAPGANALETNDGQWLYTLTGSGLSRMHSDGTGVTVIGGAGIISNLWTMGSRNLFVYDPQKHTLWKAPLGTAAFEKAYQFTESDSPQGGGLCIAVPNDESYLILRRTTRNSTTLMLMENFH